TAVNLAASLSLHGLRVLVIDLDPQGNASTALDVDHHSGAVSIYNVLVDGQPLSTVVQPAPSIPQLYCAPATIDLAGAEIELVPLVARESRLVRALAGFDSSGLDYIFIDCPPSLGLLTVNALVAADHALITAEAQYFALQGVEQAMEVVELARDGLNPELSVLGVLLNLADMRTVHSREALVSLKERFGELVFDTTVRSSIAYAESAERARSILDHRPDLGTDYVDLAGEVLARLPGLSTASERLAQLR
ncbi:MAG TPA: AAA family ATPase, partial [Solirubrobacteraceae bacterium]